MVQAHAQQLLNQKNEQEHPLVTATERLMVALNRLEGNLQHVSAQAAREAKQHQALVSFERENASLKGERDRLNNAIDDLKGQYGELHKVAGAIYNKLDDSIKRLSQIIED